MKFWIGMMFWGLLSGAGSAQAVYKIDVSPICWVTPSGVDSSLNRYSVISSRTGSQTTILHYTDANGGIVDAASGGQFFFGYCDQCTRDTLGVPRIESFVVSQPIINPFNPTVCGSAITATIYGAQSESDITVTVDGSPIDFYYDPNTRTILAETHTTTGSGVHTVIVTVTISTGTAVKTGTFDCG